MMNINFKKLIYQTSWWILSLVMLVAVSCKGGGAGGKFADLDPAEKPVVITLPTIVKILAAIPAANLISLPGHGTTTFGVTLEQTDTSVKYEFKLDSLTVLQDGTDAYYNLNSVIITGGTHTLTVKAYNTISSDSHTFNLTINSPTIINSFSPTLTGATAACTVDNLTLSALYSDANPGDTVSAKWYLNDAIVSLGNTQASVANDPSNSIASMSYHPNCTHPGVNFIRLDLFDGAETTTQTWTIFVTSAIVIHIADAIPTVDPVVFTNSSSTTFAVTLATLDATANYNFILDNTVSLQNDHRAYLNVVGGALTTGLHTLRVTASNSSSSETKTFNLVKNGPPVVTTFTPAFTGTSMTCGSTPLTLSADFTDPNNDTLTYLWTVDSAVSGTLAPGNSANHAQAVFSPTCAGAGVKTITLVANDGYETTTTTWSINVVVPLVVHINNFFPTAATNNLSSTGITTFGVTLDSTEATIKYEYKLDGTTVLQDTVNSNYNLNSASISSGAHTLVVKAYNTISNDSHTFNINVNSPTSITSFIPTLTGTTLGCSLDSVTMTAVYADANTSDTISAKWYLNDTLISVGNTQANTTNDPGNNLANANYHPDCSHPGINFIRLNLNDGKEITSQTWTVFVNSQITIHIQDAIPVTNPTIFTNTSSNTFAVTLLTPDPLATYNFVLDNTTSLQNDLHSYLNILGSGLSAGAHTLKVTASNASTNDTKTFNIRKNSIPVLAASSPALTGTAVSCSTTPITLSSDYTDADGDALTYTWTLDDVSSTQIVPNNSGNHAQVAFTPVCGNSGNKVVKVIVSDGFETKSTTWSINVVVPLVVHINSFFPIAATSNLASTGMTTFGITLDATDATVKYEFKMDGSTVLQDATIPSYNLNSATLSSGAHTFNVKAYNAISSDTHTFNINVNSPTSISSFIPALTGTTLACSHDSVALTALYADANTGDTISAKWYLNDALVSIGNSQVTTTNDPGNSLANANYHPDCTHPGINFIRLDLNDGKEITTQTWTIFVNSQIVIHIQDAIPLTNPTVFTNASSATFAVTLTTPDPLATYNFVLDNTTTVQNDLHSYLTVLGSTLSAGTHTLKVTAANASSNDSKTFNIRKNSVPVLTTFAPALSGTEVSCSSTPMTISSDYTDADSDVLAYTWTMDDASSTQLVTNNSANHAQVAFTPLCSNPGTKVIKVVVSDGYETKSTTWSIKVVVPLTLHINSFFPTTPTTTVASTGTTTFGITLDATDATVKYEFKMDGTTVLQDTSSSNYNLNSASFTSGSHTLVVKAYSAISSDTHTFNIVVNSPTSISSFIPTLTGTTLGCSHDSVALSTLYADANVGDTISAKWYLNGTLISVGNTQATTANDPGNNLANANYHPDCSTPGINFIRLDLNDGKEITTQTWSIFVSSQIVIHIQDAIPVTNPTVFTNTSSATFAVTLTTPDPLATYNFVLDNTTSLQNDLHSYLAILGSGLSAGAHTLKVTATNASSNDTKIFNIRKNSVPVLTASAPALTGVSVSCSNTPMTLSSDYTDADSDVLAYTWTLDDATSTQLVTNNSANHAQVAFTPLCSNPGTKVIKVVVSDGYETKSTTWSINVVVPLVVHINSFSPTGTSIALPSTGLATFGVTLDATDATVKYEYKLDGSTILQDTGNPVLNLNSATLTTGTHTLVVKAYNAISNDTHAFNLVVNSPAIINSFVPTLTGSTLQCGIDSVALSALYSDANGDTVNAKWYLNDTLVVLGNTQATTANDPGNNMANANYHPDCSHPGINFFRLDLNDGKEIATQTWTIFVSSPIVIHISDAIPTTNPTVFAITTSTTFAITLTTPDPTANYSFILDNSITLQNDHRTYLTLAGSGLSSGVHTLKVIASNSNSSDTKIFNIKKNSAPVIAGFSPAYSGTNLSCGGATQTLYADFTDADGDPMTYTWTVDDAPSSYIAPANTAGRATAVFTPACAIAGTRTIKAIATDGYETKTATWTISVVSPITIAITSFLPTSNPIIITSAETKTFAVALSTSDQNVTYNFMLKNLNTSVVTTLQSGTVPFYNLVGSGVTAGLYELDVIASNGSSSDHHVFSVRKNSPPALPPSPLGTFTPAATGVVLSCGSSSQLFRSDLSDGDNDIMAINWYLDSATAPANLVSTSTQTEAKATYTPTCAEVGVKNIRVDVYDGHETTSRTWTVSIINPTIASITAYSPNTDPVRVLSTSAQTFTVSASGKAPLAYEWKLDGSVIATATGAFTTISAASLTTGSHTLIAKVSDSDSNASHTFNLIKNAPPVLASKLPASTPIKININTVTNFSAAFSDANNDSMTIQWKLNNIVVGSSNANAAVVTGTTTTQMTLSPSAAILGDNTVELIVNDGYEPTSYVWNVNINYFSDVCNNMGAGRACTIIGRPGMGSGTNPVTNPESTRVQPMFLTDDLNGSYFFSDPNTHTVWFYNKTASIANILGQSIGAGKMQIVAGIGMSGTGITGISYNDFPLNTPRGLGWDNTNKRLFIANESTNQILMVDSSGVVSIIAGGGSNITANNADATLATASYCATPRGMYFHQIQKKLYVACSGSATVKAIDTSSATVSAWTMNIVTGRASAGVTATGSVDGTNGYAGTAQINAPNHLKYDTLNDVLYVTTSGDCRVRAVNLTAVAKTNYYFGSITLPASSTATVLGATCTTFTTGAFGSVRYNGGWMGIELSMSGSTLKGIFVADYNTNRVTFNNNTLSTITLGNVAIPSYTMNTIWGNSGGIAGYYMPCTSASATTCYTYTPSTLMVVGAQLYLADYSNYRVRTLNLAVADGVVTDDIGFDSKRGYAGNGGASTEYVQFNQPMNVYYNSNTAKLLISDFYNYRIRSLNMTTGRIDSFIGNGAGDANTSNADPSVVGLRGPRNVVNFQNKIIYGDNQNNNCVFRAFNTDSTNQNILGILTNANAVQTIAGNWAQGCGAWNTPVTTATAANARLSNPQGVTTDGTNLYFANTGQHCIIKVDSSGNMSALSGLCGTSGAANGAGTAFGNAAIRYQFPTAVVADPRAPYNTAGNLFILDQTTATNTKVRYLNQGTTTVTIYGITINAGEIRTIYTAADGHGSDLAAFDSMVCFSSGGDFNYSSNGTSSTANNNVICFNRDESTGTTFYRFGRNPSSFIGRGAQQYNTEEEGLAATSISLAGPAGLAFDDGGNLYIAERDAHTIRMIKRWW
ncbi:MAG: hypothetical protein H7177_17095 [Rhizobacter sp.]|nr:hypothetical protein [Bacteriovorax sp.]